MLPEVNELETEALMVSSIMKKFMFTCAKEERDFIKRLSRVCTTEKAGYMKQQVDCAFLQLIVPFSCPSYASCHV